MLALYRSGRQAEALATYRRLHDNLMTHIACRPTPTVASLHRRILQADPNLALHAQAG